MSLFYREHDDADLRAEVMAERRQRARMNHWCSECHGFTQKGSPCYVEPEETDNEEEENERE